ncbi:Protein kinase of the Mitotic Exit Network [Coemansia sp. Benny D115]|nr:Protein kinase of the Mitotic Exit Network [Coemansia sp. Benny D115]
MSVKHATSTHFGDFQPEELLGQLKAEQQLRNYDIATKFIDAVLGLQLDASTLRESLRDGVVLCRLINTLRPGAVKRINTRNLPFAQMENISNFLAAARKLGLESTDLFQTVDLYEGKNIPRVIMTLLTIARVVAGIPLNSHRKLADIQRSLGDNWNTNTLTAWATTVNSTTAAPTKGRTGAGYITLHNQPTLVNNAKIGSAKCNAGREPGSPRRNPSRKERRRSKRRSAATLFACPSPGARRRDSAVSTPKLVEDAKDAIGDDLRLAMAGLCISDPAAEATKTADTRPPLAEAKSDSTLRPPEQADALDEDQSQGQSQSQSPEDHESQHGTESCCETASIGDGTVAHSEQSAPSSRASSNGPPSNSGSGRKSREEDSADNTANGTLLPIPVPRKRPGTKNRRKERLTVYSESAKRVTHYQLGNCIGRGQFGSVYRALDLETGQMVAVKQIPLQNQDADDMDDVMQEVELLKSLSSARIVRYLGFVKTETHLSLVMEFVENGSLSATLKSFGSFPEKLVLAYAVKIIEGLVYLHGRDVVHCDLKACNILTTKKGNTKLTDFGVSLNLKLRKPGDESVVAGTPYWMAPEIIQLDGACMASDIWSLGCTIIELLTGKPPYADLMQMAALYRIVEDDHPPIPEGISEELKDFLLQCFCKSPADRPTAAELMHHAWTRQYERNRKELKMLRRTCSRKMSTVMARGRTRGPDYPAFDVAELGLPPMSPLDEEDAAKSSEGEAQKEGDEADVKEDATEEPAQPKALPAVPSPALSTISSPALPAGLPSSLAAPLTARTLVGEQDAGHSDGPRIKRHRLRTIICDGVSQCAVCSSTLSGALIQCTACKMRCHAGCQRLLPACAAMRMSRFLYPASRKSSKRFESKTPNLRLRAQRRSQVRKTASSGVSYVSASFADLIGGTCGSPPGTIFGSSDGSLRAPVASSGLFYDGFDGVVGDGRPASLAVTMGLSAAIAQAQEQAAIHALPPPGGSMGRRRGLEAADSGWETDDTAEAPAPLDTRSLSIPAQSATHPSVASIRIPAERRNVGPYSAPLATATQTSFTQPPPQQQHHQQHQQQQQPLYYQALAPAPRPMSYAPVPQPLAPLSRPRSIRRQRAYTASGDQLAGSAPDSSALSTLLRRRQHPLRGATSSDFRAVAGFSPGAAQRAKRGFHGSSASISDLKSTCSASQLFGDTEDDAGNTQCFFARPTRSETQPVGSGLLKRSGAKRGPKDCIIM